MNRRIVSIGIVCAVLSVTLVVSAHAQSINPPSNASPSAPVALAGTAIRYQGQLKSGYAPVNGTCEIIFRLYDAVSVGNQVGSALTQSIPITNGLFTTSLDFGAVFGGNSRWLDMQVRCPPGGGSYTQLSPRQLITPVPIALFSTAPWVTIGNDISYSAGNVGIGTNPTPGIKLDVSGAVLISPSVNGVIAFGTPNGETGMTIKGTNRADIRFDGTNLKLVAGAGTGVPGSTSGIVVNTSGSVAIGTSFIYGNATFTVRAKDTVPSNAIFTIRRGDGVEVMTIWGSGNMEFYQLLNGATGTSTQHACFESVRFVNCSSAAEFVPTIDDGAGFPETADLVSIVPSVKNPYSDEHAPFVVAKSDKPCDTNLLGFIVNPESGADGKKVNEHYLPLAIYGYFPAKVTLENGAIKRGDPLTSSSKPGYGMKATSACKIIGYALEDANKEGTIQVFANHGESAAPEVTALRTKVQELEDQNATLDARLTAIEKKMSGPTK